MQLNIRLLPVITLAILTTFSSCKKESSKDDDNTPTDPAVEVAAHSDDQNLASDQMDAIANDVNAAVESSTDFNGGRTMRLTSYCNADAAIDTFSNPKKITITYDGLNCFGTHTRYGVVVISMPKGARWRDPGTSLTISFQNLKFKRVSDNRSITINGSQTYTNVSGGLLMALAQLNTIIHTVTSDGVKIKFDDNTERTWKVSRKRTFTYDNGIVLSVSGTHTEGSNTQIAEWGLNRFGHAFTTSITQPLVVRQDCNFRLTAGQVKHEGFATATATFGLNASGNATTCPGLGHYYLKLEWTGAAGNSHHVILPY
ncbi:MAG: hypothetical protein ACXWCZ_01010 [Flavisolibacter sp.]